MQKDLKDPFGKLINAKEDKRILRGNKDHLIALRSVMNANIQWGILRIIYHFLHYKDWNQTLADFSKKRKRSFCEKNDQMVSSPYLYFLLLRICFKKFNLGGCFRLKNLILSKAEAPWWLLLLLRCTTAFTLGCVPAFIPLFCHKAIFTQCCSSFSSFLLGNTC